MVVEQVGQGVCLSQVRSDQEAKEDRRNKIMRYRVSVSEFFFGIKGCWNKERKNVPTMKSQRGEKFHRPENYRQRKRKEWKERQGRKERKSA